MALTIFLSSTDTNYRDLRHWWMSSADLRQRAQHLPMIESSQVLSGLLATGPNKVSEGMVRPACQGRVRGNTHVIALNPEPPNMNGEMHYHKF